MSQAPKAARLQTDRLPKRAPHVAERLVDGELVLYDPNRQRVHALNPTAAFIWLACDGRRQQASLLAELAGLYPDSRKEIETDLPEIVDLFLREGILET